MKCSKEGTEEHFRGLNVSFSQMSHIHPLPRVFALAVSSAGNLSHGSSHADPPRHPVGAQMLREVT